MAPTFEKDDSTNAGSRYVWKNSQILASFVAGGAVSIRSKDGTNLQISFVDANAGSQPQGESESPRKTWYYLGNSHWHVDEHFDRVRFREIYPGIDLVFLTSRGQLEYSFEIAPGADPSAIRIRYGGLRPNLAPGGNLEVNEGGLQMIQRRPKAFERRGNDAVAISSEYRITGQDVSIELSAYDRTAAIIIDPVLVFSTYLGGSGFDAIYAATADGSGNLYVSGKTSSGSLSNSSIPLRSSSDAFVAKLNSSGTEVLYLVYLGGGGNDWANGIAIDASGNAYLTGVTESSDFPVTRGALSTTAPGAENAFIAKFNSIGQLQYSTYLGGASPSIGSSIAVDATGAAYVAGQTQSTSFPVTTGAFQISYQGGTSDCFVSKLNATGSALVYSTLLGGAGMDLCSGIAVDTSGDAYVTGTTYSSNFPTQSAVQGSLLGTASAFVAKINPGGTGLVFSTYVGGSAIDNGNAVAIDSSGSTYVAGATSSSDFPLTSGVFQTALNGVYNAFVFKLSASGTSFVYSTLLGGSSSDTATSIAVDQSGRAILGGYTDSVNFPLAGAIQSSLGGTFDAFASVVDPAGATLVFSSYVGGSGDDRAYAVMAAPGNILYLAGTTASSNFPTAAALQASLSAPNDAFVLKATYGSAVLAPVSVTPNSGSGASQTFAFVFSDSAGAADINSAQIIINSSTAETNSCFFYFYASGSNILYLANNAGTLQSSLPVGATGTLQNSQCSVNVGASSVTLSGTTLTLNLALSFTAAFAGSKNIYMYVQNATVASSLTQEGTWTVPGAAGPVPVSVTPNSGSGASQTFAFVFSDPAGAADINSAQIVINSSTAKTNSCYLYLYASGSNILYLATNAGALQSSLAVGAAGTLQNSQCSVNVGASSVSSSGTTFTLKLALSFTTAFAGSKNIYMYVQNATVGSALTQEGTWTVPVASGPTPVSVTPSSGSGASQTFAFMFSDPAGAADINSAQIIINSSTATTNGCFFYLYASGSNVLYLANNAGALQSSLPVGAAGTLQNSQCSVNVGASSVSSSGTTFTLNLALSFTMAFAGSKNIYMYVQNATVGSSLTQEGTWTVPAASGPVPVSVTPNSGSGASQTFAFVFSDPAGAADINSAQIIINNSTATTNSCYFYLYASGANVLYLANNAGALQSGLAVGAAGTLENSQCSVNVGASSVTSSGTTFTLNLALSFTTAFAGSKNIYMYVQNATVGSSLSQYGVWTVP
ncbi:MAG: SBBP repeat-containing protein [Bryobacteraceae bacterium]